MEYGLMPKTAGAFPPDELRQLHRLAIERRPEACLGCGLEHDCSVHGCAVIRKAWRLLGGEADACL